MENATRHRRKTLRRLQAADAARAGGEQIAWVPANGEFITVLPAGYRVGRVEDRDGWRAHFDGDGDLLAASAVSDDALVLGADMFAGDRIAHAVFDRFVAGDRTAWDATRHAAEAHVRSVKGASIRESATWTAAGPLVLEILGQKPWAHGARIKALRAVHKRLLADDPEENCGIVPIERDGKSLGLNELTKALNKWFDANKPKP